MKTNLLTITFLLVSISIYSNNFAHQKFDYFNDIQSNKKYFSNYNFSKSNDLERNYQIIDSSHQKKFHKYYHFDWRIKGFNKIEIDSLLKKFRVESDFDNFLNEDFLKDLDKNFQKYWEHFPKYQNKYLDELLKDLNRKFDKDSLMKKFEFYQKKNLFDDSEIIDI